ncbi:nucleolar protein 10-like [Argonauta hians]
MQFTYANEVKIYNLSAGKSLPEWLTDRKKRQLQKTDLDVRQRVELIQDLEMPSLSSSITVTPDGKNIYVTGSYKPRVHCYDLTNLSLKFERGLDREVIKTKILSEDYSKLVFLQVNRYIEFHNQAGTYYCTRVPKYGFDMSFHTNLCDLFIVGASSQIYRLNLELGRFMLPFQTDSIASHCCDINMSHELFTCGTRDGTVECWDPRSKTRVGLLNPNFSEHTKVEGKPSVTALKYQDALKFGIGTSKGHVLLYDLRAKEPLLVKDHHYGLPIKSIHFHNQEELVLSMDAKSLRFWNQNTGKAYTAIEPGVPLTDLGVYPNSGMVFLTNEAPKVLVYFLPSIGTAPKWCSFLDSLTEELEESKIETVYDDYKFVTRNELEEIGLSHLIGSKMLRAYMHGYFMDTRLYHKAKAIIEPFAYDKYKKEKIRETIEKSRTTHVKLEKLPPINKDLAAKLRENLEEEEKDGKEAKKSEKMPNLLKDKRFAAMFYNKNFRIDRNSKEFHLISPLISKLEKDLKKEKKKEVKSQFKPVEEEELEGKMSEEESDESTSEEDEVRVKEQLREEHRNVKREKKGKVKERRSKNKDGGGGSREDLTAFENGAATEMSKPKFYELKEGDDILSKAKKKNKKSLFERLTDNNSDLTKTQRDTLSGHMEFSFSLKKDEKEEMEHKKRKEHHMERKKLRRSAHTITRNFKSKPKFWMGKRVR